MRATTAHSATATRDPRDLPRLTTTVPKEYVHRASLAEVFLSSCTPRAPLAYTLTGQWPRAHTYFTGPDPSSHDPLQVAETIRQAGILLAHTELGVPLGHHFVLWALSYTTDPAGLRIHNRPTDFTIQARCTELLQRRTTINRATIEMTLHRDHTPIAHGAVTFSTISPAVYTRLRGTTTPRTGTNTSTGASAGTGCAGASAGCAGASAGAGCTGTGAGTGCAGTGAGCTGVSAGCTGASAGMGCAGAGAGCAGTGTGVGAGCAGATPPMTPASVNRRSPTDVVLTPTSHPRRWLLTPNLDHPVLFDHTGDHIPGMVLLEAARQAAHATANTPAFTPTHTTTTFTRYTEFDHPCTIEVTHTQPDNNTTTTIHITGHQQNHTVFNTTITGPTT
ncbi:AfsA-related hotdog domain-containing protein [Streptomyces sp. NPDC002698]|uniref:AfsA-related hotdog domain-containing protein n=1 Tax=Streptomyces sp. NPDC002698 TaxID=3364660 RepID=UPI00368B2832